MPRCVTFGLQVPLTDTALRRVDAARASTRSSSRCAPTTTLASFVTWIVVADPTATPADTDPVRLASVWSVVAAPVRNADGSPNGSVLAELAPGGRLADIADLLQTRGSDAADARGRAGDARVVGRARAGRCPRSEPGVASVKAAVERTSNQLLPAPYVPIDLTSLEAAGLGAQLPDQLRTGSSTLDQITGVSPDTRTAFVDPIDAADARAHTRPARRPRRRARAVDRGHHP